MDSIILLIEDNAIMADNISSILEIAQYKVLSAPNGKSGVAMAKQHHPDLILCDIMMPELDGYGVRHILSSDPGTENIPFIFLTAKSEKADFRAGMNLGADDYITKPFDDVDLLKVIEIRMKKKSPVNSNSPTNTLFNKSKEFPAFQRLAENNPLRVFRKKSFLFMEGQSANDLFLIKRGSVKTFRMNNDGKELITRIYCEGEYVGYVSVLEEKPYAENAEALEETVVTLIPKNDFLSLIYSNKDVARKFIQLLSATLGMNEKRLLDLAYQSVRQRLAGVLLQIAVHHSRTNDVSVITTARKDIANLIGTAVESLNRTLSDFKDEGLIEMSEEGLNILDRTKLESISR